jgi:cell division protein FtsB
MTTLAHQHIVHKLNRRAEVERENARMDDIERRAAPLFYAVFGIAAAVMLWTLTAGYRDVIQHRLDTMADRQQYDRISATLSRCANGAVVSFDDGLMTCRIKRLVVMK